MHKNPKWKLPIALFGLLFTSACTDLSPVPLKFRISNAVEKSNAWYQNPQGIRVADNVVTWQNNDGGWFKNYDPRQPRPDRVPDVPNLGPASDADEIWHEVSTFDNNATWSEMRILARAYTNVPKIEYRQAFDRGLQYIFDAQYPNGGWPQRFPLQDNYGRYITINDNAMLGVVTLLKDIADGAPDFTFVTPEQKLQAQKAWQRGVDCFLDCQIRVNGKPTVWCQQHDEVTLAPAGGRTFELPSFCGQESAAIALFLMTIDHPNRRLRESIEGAVAWFDEHKITGKKYVMLKSRALPGGRDRWLVDDPKGSPLWARFYDLQTGKPIFISRDGIPRSSVDQITHERRNSYAWYGDWAKDLDKKYKEWKSRRKHADSRPIAA